MMTPHHDAFAIAKFRQRDLETEAAASRVVKKDEKPETGPERRLKLFVRVRHA